MNAPGKHELIGASNALHKVWRQIQQVAATHAPVLICGEKGAGKTLAAELIQEGSTRRDQPFFKIHCSEMDADLLERELFGFEETAVSGNWQTGAGWAAKARNGTIYFDEIAALAPSTQVKLLRLLEDRVFEPLGSITPITSDVRILAATSRPLEQLVKRQSFRQDLFFRLNVFPIHVPPLREHKLDIPALVEHFISRYAQKYGKTIKGIVAPGKSQLMRHRWPGNVRELEECIEKAIAASTDEWIHIDTRCCPFNFWIY